MKFSNIVSVVLMFIIFACNDNTPPVFIHDITEGPTPWTSKPFDDDQYRFAVFSDLTGGERERIFEVAVEQLNLLRPEFILCVGDLIEGGTEDVAQLEKEWNSFDRRASKTIAPVFRVGGNHDLTNSTMRKYWEQRYGNTYYHFVYKNTLFLILNSEDFDEETFTRVYEARKTALKLRSEGKQEEFRKSEYMNMEERSLGFLSDIQTEYFEKVIDNNPEVRWTFLFMHKPVWQRENEGGLGRIEKALGNRPFTVFNGHEHAYNYTISNGNDYIKLGTTGGGQSPNNPNAFDHITFITMKDDGPVIANLKMEGILDKTAKVPLDGDTLNFHAFKSSK